MLLLLQIMGFSIKPVYAAAPYYRQVDHHIEDST